MRPSYLFLALLFIATQALRAERVYLGAYTGSRCAKFEALAAYQVGTEILVTCLDYSSGICTTDYVPRVMSASIDLDGPALIAMVQETYAMYGYGLDGSPVALTLQDTVLGSYDAELANEYAYSPILGYIDARLYPWVYSEWMGWLYVVPGEPVTPEEYLTYLQNNFWEDYGGVPLEGLAILNTYWFCNEDGQWLYGSVLNGGFLWNTSVEEWINSEPIYIKSEGWCATLFEE